MKPSNTHKQFRILYGVGLILSFVSLFIEWYIYEVYDSNNHLKSYWSYNPITGWTTVFSEKSTVNNALKPNTFHMPIMMTIIYIFVLAISAYTVLFRDIEQYEKLEKLMIHAYSNLFLIMLMLYYIFVFPVFYLIPNDLYFPFVYIKDKDTGLVYRYSIGPGYWAQIIGFMCVVPYAFFYYFTVSGFQSEEHSAKDVVAQFVEQIQDLVDMDALIAKEKLKLKFGNDFLDPPVEPESYHSVPIKQRGGS
jgi:hypothetical protein